MKMKMMRFSIGNGSRLSLFEMLKETELLLTRRDETRDEEKKKKKNEEKRNPSYDRRRHQHPELESVTRVNNTCTPSRLLS